MISEFDANGLLPPGIYWASWEELTERFGYNRCRQRLVTGLKAALENLKSAGCQTVYLNGSFVTSESTPTDYDACWKEEGVDTMALDPILLPSALESAIAKKKQTAKETYGEKCFGGGETVADIDNVTDVVEGNAQRQKARYGGEFYLASDNVNESEVSFVEFFQTDKNTRNPKGIIAIDLGSL